MNQADKDLVAFYNALPNWAQGEFQQLLKQADRGEIDKPQLAELIQDLMNRAEHTVGGPATFTKAKRGALA